MPYIPNTLISSGTGASAPVDPVFDQFGDPTTAFEFESSSLAGLTALSPTPDVENADTTIPDAYYVEDNAAGNAFCGRYAAAPSAPFTAIAKVIGTSVRANFNKAGLFIGEGTPGVLEFVANAGTEVRLVQERYATPTSFTSQQFAGCNGIYPPFYLAIVVNTSTDVDFALSTTAYGWIPAVLARNPGITIGSVGIGLNSENANGCIAAFDYLRIWNSALTLPGT